jgi:Capsule polysaccharide biosynthesis protein
MVLSVKSRSSADGLGMIIGGVDLAELNDEEVIFFIRIRGKKSYFHSVYSENFIDLFANVRKFRCISEYARDADIRIDLRTADRDWLTREEYDELVGIADIQDVIRRCRGLRAIGYDEAIRLIYRCFLFFDRLFKEEKKLKLVVTGAVDNYVMDLMHRVGTSRGVKFIGVTDSFMSPEYKLITVRGELGNLAEVDPAEVDRVHEVLKGRMTAPSNPSRRQAYFSAAYDLGSYLYRYVMRYLLRYKLMGDVGYEYRFAPMLHKFHSLGQIRATFKLGSFDFSAPHKGKLAYIPLHFYPEATTDYWIHDPFHVNYATSVTDTVRNLVTMGYTVIVKEHPAYYLARGLEFYRALERQGAVLLDPFVPTKRLLEEVDLTVVWNGSTGVEAIINKRPVVKITNSYYGDGLIPYLTTDNMTPLVADDETGRNVVKTILSTSFRTY